jgi:hypothetical protein
MKTIVAPLGAIVLACGLSAPVQAQDGKDPPGVDPTHYQCYQVKAPASAITVKTLRDQFGAAEAIKIGTPLYLCAPTEKNGQPRKDTETHYLCYQDKVKPPNRKVRVINQFTKPPGIPVTVLASAFLCVPSIKILD